MIFQSGSLKICLAFWKSFATILLPIIMLPLMFNSWENDDPNKEKSKCAYVVLLMAFSWMLELLPLPVTSLIPVVLFPIFGIMNTGDVSKEYLNKTCMLMMGGNILQINNLGLASVS